MSGLIFLAVFFALIGLAALLGMTVDSREPGDWSPSNEGRRSTPL